MTDRAGHSHHRASSDGQHCGNLRSSDRSDCQAREWEELAEPGSPRHAFTTIHLGVSYQETRTSALDPLGSYGSSQFHRPLCNIDEAVEGIMRQTVVSSRAISSGYALARINIKATGPSRCGRRSPFI
jgi:hypothetical protein